MFDIDAINTLSELVFERPIDFIFAGICISYIIWLAWYIKNDKEVY